MRTNKQIEASKTNGAKSSGPVTPDGKARSSQNGMRHNLSGGHIVLLSNEDPEKFIEHSYGFLDRYAPADYVERDLVNQMIAASWRQSRISAIETSMAEMEMLRQQPDIERQFEFADPHTRQTLALFGDLDRASLTLTLQRYHAAASRAYTRALRMLKELQGDRFGRQPEAPPVAPGSTKAPTQTAPAPEQPTPEHATPKESNERLGVKSHTPKVIILKLRSVENAKLQNEPKTLSCSERAMCA